MASPLPAHVLQQGIGCDGNRRSLQEEVWEICFKSLLANENTWETSPPNGIAGSLTPGRVLGFLKTVLYAALECHPKTLRIFYFWVIRFGGLCFAQRHFQPCSPRSTGVRAHRGHLVKHIYQAWSESEGWETVIARSIPMLCRAQALALVSEGCGAVKPATVAYSVIFPAERAPVTIYRELSCQGT